jgi:hypothetical protein
VKSTSRGSPLGSSEGGPAKKPPTTHLVKRIISDFGQHSNGSVSLERSLDGVLEAESGDLGLIQRNLVEADAPGRGRDWRGAPAMTLQEAKERVRIADLWREFGYEGEPRGKHASAHFTRIPGRQHIIFSPAFKSRHSEAGSCSGLSSNVRAGLRTGLRNGDRAMTLADHVVQHPGPAWLMRPAGDS